MCFATCEIVWLWRLIREFEVFNLGYVPLFAENTSSLLIATNPVFHELMKHIEVDCHFIRDHVSKDLHLPHLSSNDQLADFFAKAMTKSLHDFLTIKLMWRVLEQTGTTTND